MLTLGMSQKISKSRVYDIFHFPLSLNGTDYHIYARRVAATRFTFAAWPVIKFNYFIAIVFLLNDPQ